MSSVSHILRRNGVLNLPRASPASKTLTEALLWKDAQQNHCYFKQSGLHNHLSHHILAAYDLGASPGLLQKIYDNEASSQRPIVLEEKDKDIAIDEDSWSQYLGDQNAYSAFVTFFESRVSSFGAVKTIEEFIFSPAANEEGKCMLTRLMSGALHPFILLGYALEFGNDALVATGIATACIHIPVSPALFKPESKTDSTTYPPGRWVNGEIGLSVLEILSLLQSSPALKPVMPYDPNALVSARIKSALQDGRQDEIIHLCSRFHVDETLRKAGMMAKIEELIRASVLLLFATGKEGRKPRLDFFLMHLVTSSLFLRSYINVLENPAHKATIIKAFLPGVLLFSLIRGRPTIKPNLLMGATDKPRPPNQFEPPYKQGHGIGSPLNDEDYNPWPALIETSIHFSDSHVLKTMRTLLLAEREYGNTETGRVIGIFKQSEGMTNANANANGMPLSEEQEETFEGIAKLDGSIFVRAAGMLMDYMGWTTYGQPERDDWDRSALGWDDAWNDEDN
ncbi:hypothetical protein BT96DRAFT_872370 [Gymnopus androsaceus JB14]|uniref:Oxidoreductase AflY n=1 Tax=Gymnopus androsaceus JB14 TaxID=1447944 RepID=A0A6A4IGL2_9AGAR|nr:hypothetical protein BT96DRAFT_872370 [Gymnopus androsaceus JB14]